MADGGATPGEGTSRTEDGYWHGLPSGQTLTGTREDRSIFMYCVHMIINFIISFLNHFWAKVVAVGVSMGLMTETAAPSLTTPAAAAAASPAAAAASPAAAPPPAAAQTATPNKSQAKTSPLTKKASPVHLVSPVLAKQHAPSPVPTVAYPVSAVTYPVLPLLEAPLSAVSPLLAVPLFPGPDLVSPLATVVAESFETPTPPVASALEEQPAIHDDDSKQDSTAIKTENSKSPTSSKSYVKLDMESISTAATSPVVSHPVAELDEVRAMVGDIIKREEAKLTKRHASKESKDGQKSKTSHHKTDGDVTPTPREEEEESESSVSKHDMGPSTPPPSNMDVDHN